jgi:2-polyprenyl-3-methyl-5-hydroxy-6-metoxy-1,4-benzoquinol methylase
MVPSTRVSHTDRRQTQTDEQYAADDLETMREAKRYGAHLFRLFRPFVGRRVLEVGCGIGTMSRRLTEVADTVMGIEPNPHCADLVRAEMAGDPKFSLRTCLLEECDLAELSSHRFDTVFCVNVLEHIEDDREALRSFHRVLTPGGHVLIWVPAVQAAYGPLDAELGHFRRYSKASLGAAFEAAGLDIVTLRYSNPIGLLGWMFNAHVLKSREHSIGQVRLFDNLIAPWALPIERLAPPPIGLSLIAVGRRR